MADTPTSVCMRTPEAAHYLVPSKLTEGELMIADQKYRARFGGGGCSVKRRLITTLRTREVRKVLDHRYGPHGGVVPDDDAGRDDLAVLLAYIVELNPVDAIRRAATVAREYAPWLSEDEAILMAEHAAPNPVWPSADALADRLGVTYAIRCRLELTTIGSTDVRKDERDALKRQRNKEGMQARRRAEGVRSRDEYLAGALSNIKPWEREGISRRTWERRRARQRAPVEKTASKNVVLLASYKAQHCEQRALLGKAA